MLFKMLCMYVPTYSSQNKNTCGRERSYRNFDGTVSNIGTTLHSHIYTKPPIMYAT